MTWIHDVPPAPTGWESISVLLPGPTGAVEGLHRSLWESVDPVLLELARLRFATLLGFAAGLRLRSDDARAGGLSEEKIGALSAWPTSPLFSDRERDCLALAEQFLFDANGVTDELVNAVLEHLSPGECYGFVSGLSALEGLQRAALTLGLDESPEAHWLASAPMSPAP